MKTAIALAIVLTSTAAARAQDLPMPSAVFPSIDVGIINQKLPNGELIQVAAFVESRLDGLVYFQRCNRMDANFVAHQVAILVTRSKGQPSLVVNDAASVDICPWVKAPQK